MTTQPEQATTAPQQQGSHFWLITVSAVSTDHRAVNYLTRYGHITPGEGQTRQDVFDQLCQLVATEIGGRVTVLHFQVEPNQL